jgi:hypothetical protein
MWCQTPPVADVLLPADPFFHINVPVNLILRVVPSVPRDATVTKTKQARLLLYRARPQT